MKPIALPFHSVLLALAVESLEKQGMQVNDIGPAEAQRMRERVKPVCEAQAKNIGDAISAKAWMTATAPDPTSHS